MPAFNSLAIPHTNDVTFKYDMLSNREATYVYLNRELEAVFIAGFLTMVPGRHRPLKAKETKHHGA